MPTGAAGRASRCVGQRLPPAETGDARGAVGSGCAMSAPGRAPLRAAGGSPGPSLRPPYRGARLCGGDVGPRPSGRRVCALPGPASGARYCQAAAVRPPYRDEDPEAQAGPQQLAWSRCGLWPPGRADGGEGCAGVGCRDENPGSCFRTSQAEAGGRCGPSGSPPRAGAPRAPALSLASPRGSQRRGVRRGDHARSPTARPRAALEPCRAGRSALPTPPHPGALTPWGSPARLPGRVRPPLAQETCPSARQHLHAVGGFRGPTPAPSETLVWLTPWTVARVPPSSPVGQRAFAAHPRGCVSTANGREKMSLRRKEGRGRAFLCFLGEQLVGRGTAQLQPAVPGPQGSLACPRAGRPSGFQGGENGLRPAFPPPSRRRGHGGPRGNSRRAAAECLGLLVATACPPDRAGPCGNVLAGRGCQPLAIGGFPAESSQCEGLAPHRPQGRPDQAPCWVSCLSLAGVPASSFSPWLWG